MSKSSSMLVLMALVAESKYQVKLAKEYFEMAINKSNHTFFKLMLKNFELRQSK